MARLVAIAAAEGCSRLGWTVDLVNPSAIGFHNALGAATEAKAFCRVEAQDFAGLRNRLG